MSGHATKIIPDEILADLDLLDLELLAKNVPENIYERTYQANSDQLLKLSDIFGQGTLNRVNIRYDLVIAGKNSFKMTSDIEAEIEQNCVITLEPLTNQIKDQSITIFMSPRRFEEMLKEDEEDILSDDNLEPMDDGILKIGRILYEQLAGAIDHYPKAPGAELGEVEAPDKMTASPDDSPFAVLAGRKKDERNS